MRSRTTTSCRVPQGALRPMLIVVALLMAFLTTLLGPQLAGASQCPGADDDLSCPGRQQCVRVERRPCPPSPKRPLFYRRAACCQDGRAERLLERLRRLGVDKGVRTRVRCSHFSHCPSRTPS